jgi:hypothetical protein
MHDWDFFGLQVMRNLDTNSHKNLQLIITIISMLYQDLSFVSYCQFMQLFNPNCATSVP